MLKNKSGGGVVIVVDYSKNYTVVNGYSTFFNFFSNLLIQNTKR